MDLSTRTHAPADGPVAGPERRTATPSAAGSGRSAA